jgi:hypothetical protein
MWTKMLKYHQVLNKVMEYTIGIQKWR